MKLIINGEHKVIQAISGTTSLDRVINQLDHHPQSIVVEFNGMIIQRKNWPSQQVSHGDKIEIVTIVGGGSF